MARNYIAEHDGKSAVGLVARAWVADRAGRSDEALSMYRQCLADERTAAYCAYRMLLPGTREKISAADFERISSLVDNQKFGALHDPTGLLNYMFLYRAKVLNDEPGAYKFLERWEKNYPQYSASYLVIRGDYESNFKNDYVASLKSYLAAEKIDPANSEIQLRIIDLVFDHFPSLTSANEGNAANNAPFLKGDKAVVAFAQCAKYVAANRSTNPIAASSLLIHTADRLRQDLQLVTISSNIDQFDRLETFEFARAKFRDGGLPVESL